MPSQGFCWYKRSMALCAGEIWSSSSQSALSFLLFSSSRCSTQRISAVANPKQAKSSELYDHYSELDRLEELLEDMQDLGVTSIDEIEARMLLLNTRIDELEADVETP